MASVGYDLYVKMIEETIREMRGDVSRGDIDTRVDIKIDAYLPQEYVSNDLLRVEMYKKIASIRNEENREDLIEELIDRFGDPQGPVMNLVEIAQLRALCSKLAIDYVTFRGEAMIMRFSISADIDLVRVLMAVKQYPEIKVQGGNPPTLVHSVFRISQEELLRRSVKLMQKVVDAYEALGSSEDDPSGEDKQ